MKKNQMKVLAVLAFTAMGLVVSCNRDDASTTTGVEKSAEFIDQPTAKEAFCGYVDGNWPSTASLSTTLTPSAGTSADASYMASQNREITTFWKGSSAKAPNFKFVRNGSDWNSTYNAISYGTGNIYFGEGIFKDAKAKDASNLVNVMVLAHEYGHQLQFSLGLPSVEERTARAGELEADGMAGYYLRRGLGKTSFAQIATAYDFASSIGDHGVNNPGHHGTPAQRRSAVRLGFLLAGPKNAKLSAQDFDHNFFYYYKGVLAGTYRMEKPASMSQEGHDEMMSHMTELVKLNSGKMSDTEYTSLD